MEEKEKPRLITGGFGTTLILEPGADPPVQHDYVTGKPPAAEVNSSIGGTETGKQRRKNIIFFDFDGTLSPELLNGARFTEYLKDKGIFDGKAYNEWEVLEKGYKEGTVDQNKMSTGFADIFSKGLSKKREDDVKAWAGIYVGEKVKYYDGVKKTISRLRDTNDYDIVIISASPQVLLDAIGRDLGATVAYGAYVPIENGSFTGKKPDRYFTTDGKREVVKTILKEYTNGTSAAVGDSKGDIGMMELVERAVVWNPHDEVNEYAQKRGWPVLSGNDYSKVYGKITNYSCKKK